MSHIDKDFNQTILYWAPSTLDGYGGKTYVALVSLTGKWEDRQQLFTDSNGEQNQSTAVIFLPQDVVKGGWLYLGAESSIASSDDSTKPEEVEGAREIRGFNKIPDVEGELFERKAFL